ncbi:hypothetical protein M1146_06630 [Patescibacteria group bacterium]|nr:hypothetical protein [Patescibacteria group bacterium]
MGHYNEPPIALKLATDGSRVRFKLEYEPRTGTSSWKATRLSREEEELIFNENLTKDAKEKEETGVNGNMETSDEPSFFAVYPRTDCRHISNADAKVWRVEGEG